MKVRGKLRFDFVQCTENTLRQHVVAGEIISFILIPVRGSAVDSVPGGHDVGNSEVVGHGVGGESVHSVLQLEHATRGDEWRLVIQVGHH